MPDNDNKYVRTTWRTVQKIDADTWRKLRDDAPYRFVRWLLALAVVGVSWYILGVPHEATAWLPVLGIVVLLVLPDASSIAFGSFAYQARQAAGDAARAAADQTTSRLEILFKTGAETGGVAGESAQARSAPQQPADIAVKQFLLGRPPGPVDADQ